VSVPQPGIFAQGTRAHYHLELDLRPDATDEAICRALHGLREPSVTVGGANIVVGFGADLTRRLLPGDVPDELEPFAGVSGSAGGVPATPHDVWVWAHGTGHDLLLDVARAVAACLAPIATLAAEQPGFVYLDSRDLTGFIDGTENPPVEEAHDVAIVADGPGEGGAHVFTGRFVPNVAVDDGAQALQHVALGQSYPNPADDAATIAFELPRAGEVSLRLYDVAGREIAVLASGRWERGRHLVPVATDRLAPGAYDYVLKAGGMVETRKLLVRR